MMDPAYTARMRTAVDAAAWATSEAAHNRPEALEAMRAVFARYDREALGEDNEGET